MAADAVEGLYFTMCMLLVGWIIKSGQTDQEMDHLLSLVELGDWSLLLMGLVGWVVFSLVLGFFGIMAFKMIVVIFRLTKNR